MPRPRCLLCDQPSSVHETVVGPAGPVERHYCKVHGGPVWGAALPPVPAKVVDITRWAEEFRRGGPGGNA